MGYLVKLRMVNWGLVNSGGGIFVSGFGIRTKRREMREERKHSGIRGQLFYFLKTENGKRKK